MFKRTDPWKEAWEKEIEKHHELDKTIHEKNLRIIELEGELSILQDQIKNLEQMIRIKDIECNYFKKGHDEYMKTIFDPDKRVEVK